MYMINQRIFLNVIDEDQKPIPGCKVRIENKSDNYEANTDFSGIVEFLVPLGTYVLTLEHSYFRKKIFRMRLRDGFSFTRIILNPNGYGSGGSSRDINERPIIRENNSMTDVKEKKIEKKSIPIEDNIGSNSEIIFNSNKEENIEHTKSYVNDIKNKAESLSNSFQTKSIEANENDQNNFIKTEIFEGDGIFDGVSSATFDDILSGAKSILQDILEFANSVDFENSQYTDGEKLNENPYNEKKHSKEWSPEEITREKFGVQYDGETYDINDYEEEFFEPMSSSKDK